jgi:steroid 5-alpha reductase family enzyme
MTKEKITGIVWQFVAYAFALVIASRAYEHFCYEEIWLFLIANIAATSLIFFFSYAFENANFYIPYWSFQPVVVGAVLISQEQMYVNATRQGVVFLIILVWSIRLMFNFLRNWKSLEDEDWRYTKLEEQSGQWFLLVSYFGIMMLPTFLVYAGCIPLFDILKNSSVPFGIWDIIGAIIGIIGISFQWISDSQLFKFIKNRKDNSEIMNTGLWKYSRHPNYFGEICIWVSIAIFSIGATGDLEWYNALGMIGIILFFNFISIPMQEKQLVLSKPNYINEQVIRSKLFPWKPKK